VARKKKQNFNIIVFEINLSAWVTISMFEKPINMSAFLSSAASLRVCLTAVMIASSLLIAASVPRSGMLRLRMGELNRGGSQCLEPRTTLANGALDQGSEIVGLDVWRQNGVTCRQQSPLNCWKRELRKLDAASRRSMA
jgi:hypothetical protein